MRFDINKLLDLNYLNSFASQLNIEINELNASFLKLYNLNMLEEISVDEVDRLFIQYGINNTNIIQYLESDFIDVNWEFADLFSDDISYSAELKESIKNNALKEIEELNKKITEINDNIKKKIELIQKDIYFINLMLKLLNSNEITSENDVNMLLDFILEQEYTDEERFEFSNNAVRYLIAKNKELSFKEVKVDTESFEKQLDEVYDSVDIVEENIDDKIEEPVYSETILGYYKFYKDIINEVGIGSNLTEVMDISNAMATGIDSTLHSINKDDFCLELGASLYALHNAQNKEKVDQELIADALMDLAILDRIYEENDKNNDIKNNLLSKIEDDISVISLMPLDTVDNSFVQRIVNILNLLRAELKNNLIDTIGINEIKSKYKKVHLDVSKIPLMIKQLSTLTNLNNKIVSVLQSRKGLKDEDYTNLSALQANVLSLGDEIKTKEYSVEFEEKINDFWTEFTKFLKVEEIPKDKPVELNGFVLFDFDENFVPYVIDDLDPNSKNNLIDNSIVQKKLNSGFEDYSKLINDLLIYGEPEIIYDGMQTYYLSRIMDNVYYDDSRNHPTGIVRIRPLRNSLVRFASKEIVLRPNTEIYKQVIGLISEILPKVVINTEKEFSLFINFSSAMKLYDTDSYVETIHRYDRRSALYNLFLARPDRTKLTEEECSLLKDIIHMTLDAYVELEKRNDKLKFNIINQIGGKKSRG